MAIDADIEEEEEEEEEEEAIFRPDRLTFRRICFAVLAVVTAFVCIMLQTLPFWSEDELGGSKGSAGAFDAMLYELLEVRHIADHLSRCGDLNRNDAKVGFEFGWRGIAEWLKKKDSDTNCADGVLHIPPLRARSASDSLLQFPSPTIAPLDENQEFLLPYKEGVNASWFFPCKPIANKEIPDTDLSEFLSEEAIRTSGNFTCPSEDPAGSTVSACRPEGGIECATTENQFDAFQKSSNSQGSCFRGVHDGIITQSEVQNVLFIAFSLIASGGDHVKIRRDVQNLLEPAPSIQKKLEDLLRQSYGVTGKIHPVAFRVSAALPMDGSSLQFIHGQKKSTLVRAVNNTVGSLQYFYSV